MTNDSKAGANGKAVFAQIDSQLRKTDPEFMALFENFAMGEVAGSSQLKDTTRMLAILAALMGCQAVEEFKGMLPVALNLRVSPVMVKEVVYQAVAYLGIGRMLPFLLAANEVLTSLGEALPLAGQATTTPDTRLREGVQAQADIFGEHMHESWQSGPEETRHINRWLAANCFGDWYTRAGLDYRQREMITFCFLAAQGGCEPQLVAHASANIRIGNDKAFLIDVLSQCLPYIGYPRSLNALRCLHEAAQQTQHEPKRADKPDNPSVFAQGDKLPERFAQHFTGQAYLNPLTDKGGPIANVTFEPGCRNNWHIHHKGGQILLATGGRGWYQAWGEPARALHPGDVVEIPPEVKHWHGAAADSWFAHLAVEIPAEGATVAWLEPVMDETYARLPNMKGVDHDE